MDIGEVSGKGKYKAFGKDLAKEKESSTVEKAKADSKGHGKEKEKEIGKEKTKERKAKEKEQVVSFVDSIHIGAECVLSPPTSRCHC